MSSGCSIYNYDYNFLILVKSGSLQDIGLKREKRQAPEKTNRTVLQTEPLSATVELGLILDYGVWTRVKFPNDRPVSNPQRAFELVLYFAHVVSKVCL